MEEFEDLSSRMPDLASALAQRIAAKKGGDTNGSNAILQGTVDPYQLMLKKKRQEDTGEIDPNSIVKWPEEDVRKLQDYCTRMGIVGFSSGRMNPIAALAMLKQQLGDDYTGVPLEERIPAGYEKSGTHSSYGPNYPYSQAMNKKQIIHG